MWGFPERRGVEEEGEDSDLEGLLGMAKEGSRPAWRWTTLEEFHQKIGFTQGRTNGERIVAERKAYVGRKFPRDGLQHPSKTWSKGICHSGIQSPKAGRGTL